MQEYLAEVVDVKHLTLNAVEIAVRLVAPEEVQYKAGQAMQLKLLGKFLELPIITPPSENNQLFNLCIQYPKQGPLYDFARALTVGEQIKLRGPTGEFAFKDLSKDILCIAHGAGITIFASLIPDLLITQNYHNKLKLVFEVNSEEDIFYFEKFSLWERKHDNFSFMPIMVRPHSHWPGEVGTAATFVQVSGKAFKDYDVYVSDDRIFVDRIVLNWHKYVSDKKELYAYVIASAD